MERISLRQWRDDDLEPYAAMNRDPEVMRYFLAPSDREQSATSLARQRALIDERGWGLWVVDVDGAFAGFTGLSVPAYAVPFAPCVEIGWRLRPEFWGRSIAYRAAQEALARGFSVARLPEIVSFTTTVNARSIRLMERLGLSRDPRDDFDHPLVPAGHPLLRHVLYRIQREQFEASAR